MSEMDYDFWDSVAAWKHAIDVIQGRKPPPTSGFITEEQMREVLKAVFPEDLSERS